MAMESHEDSSDHIRFNCEHLRKKGKYSLETLDARQKRILERKLHDYEKHSLASFKISKGVDLHKVDFGQWKNAPTERQQRQVREEISGDVPEEEPARRFRVSGKMRALGFMHKGVFFVVWVDPNHEMGG